MVDKYNVFRNTIVIFPKYNSLLSEIQILSFRNTNVIFFKYNFHFSEIQFNFFRNTIYTLQEYNFQLHHEFLGEIKISLQIYY